MNLIDHTRDLNALDKLWTMNDGFDKDTSGSSKKVKIIIKLMLKKMPKKKFSQYNARIWDITNPYDSMLISYAQTPVDNWIGYRVSRMKRANLMVVMKISRKKT